MSDDHTARLALPYLAGGQLQKHVTLNDALSRLDALLHLGVVSRSETTEPVDPEEGQAWLLPAGAVGAAWSALTEGRLAAWRDGGWLALDPPLGTLAFVEDEDQFVVRDASGWRPLGEVLSRIDQVDLLGIATSPDAANPLSARLNGVLFAALAAGEGGTDDLRLALSKTAAADVASLLFQTDFQGRAEIGLIGSDAFGLKVSPDGTSWTESFQVEPATGRATFARGVQRRESTVFNASGTYAPPAWARSVEATVLAAGA
jgi:hypothetical protein